ncbi:carcinoembryonic antigen-related cell adhesion molecule 18 [Echinops telfairi]|uniref:Carcinoembryonic antigen-related cell adhesion molecule 18 n=1 Tax=Echinops telfairi TaxID=9371 RepID=A0ABM0ZSE5_ECHTE|nr:carcinoembryonic antigen-related cell adhesion molecule 18 [Echinops telfairi]
MIVSYDTSSKQWLQGPKFSGRENVTASGSLVIQDLELTDSGNYTVMMERANEQQRATGSFVVLELDKEPIATSNTTSVVENIEPIAFFCDTNNTKITWYFNFRKVSSNDRMTISQDNKTLIIHRLQRYDDRVYCQIVTILDLEQQSNVIRLNVFFGPESMSIKSTPTANGFTSVLSAEIGSKVEMECTHHQSNPNPKYRWFHNNSLLTVSGTKMTFTVSWNRLGKYRCVLENSGNQVILYKDIHVQLPEPRYDPKGLTVSGPMAVLLIVVTAMGGVYLCGILVYMLISYHTVRPNRALIFTPHFSRLYVQKAFRSPRVQPLANCFQNPESKAKKLQTA